MSLETCPFCGRTFKRLKSHLPHCKMSPGSKTAKITNKQKETTTFKHPSNMDKSKKVNIDTGLNYPTFNVNSISPVKSRSKKVEKVSVDKEFVQNIPFTLATNASKVPSTEEMRLKTKWHAKREQEMLNRAKHAQTRIEFTLVSQQQKHNCETHKNAIKDTPLIENEFASCQKKLTGTTSQLTNCTASYPFESLSWTTECQTGQSVPACKSNANVSELIQNNTKCLTKENTLGLSVKEQVIPVFQAKTYVWDHIKHGLIKRRFDCVPVVFPKISAHKVSLTKCLNLSEAVHKPYKGNDQNVTMKTSPKTSDQSPVEDMLCSQLQSMSVLAYSPEMATGYGGTFYLSSHSEISSNENSFMTYQTAIPSQQSQGLLTELRLGDVRLNDLASWLYARTPKLPREAVTLFNKGWQWYYRKYIDVKKGGIGGIAMLIGGYCALSYIWSYPHIKKHRWRKYH